MNLKVKKLSQFLYEDKFPASERLDIWFRLLEIYNLPFERETVENLFELLDALVGSEWEDFHVFEKEYYIKDIDLEGEEDVIIQTYPLPKTVAEFIDDCIRIWDFPLIWDGNLVRRKFKYTP
jgi:hypothetical protein